MARVDVKEVGAKRLLHVVAEAEAEHIDIERHHRVDMLDRQHGVAEAERAGAEAGNRTARDKRRLVDLGPVKCLEAVAGRIAKRNQAANAPVIGERLRFGDDVDLCLFQPCCQRRQRGGIRDLPAEETRAVRHRAVDDDALLAVVHPERQQRRAALDRLQADQPGPELPPIVQIGRAEPDISQSLHRHRAPPLLSISSACSRSMKS